MKTKVDDRSEIINKIEAGEDSIYPVYIAIPHQLPAERWYLTEATKPDEGDRYICGDHDLHSILKIENEAEMQSVFEKYDGHQWPCVRTIAETVLHRIKPEEDRAEIINKIEAGEYKIEHEEDCGCRIDWEIDANGELIEEIDSDCCWEGNILYIGDEAIAQSIRYEGSEVLVDGIDRDDIPDDIWDEMRMGEMVERGQSPNCDTHEANLREALIDWIMESNYVLDREDERGFANEYTMILREVAEGETAPAITREAAEEWADRFLYRGDAATEAFNGFRLEGPEEEEDEDE